MQDVAAGLFSLHSRGLIHLDLKSPNLLITGDRRVKIADFGNPHTTPTRGCATI